MPKLSVSAFHCTTSGTAGFSTRKVNEMEEVMSQQPNYQLIYDKKRFAVVQRHPLQIYVSFNDFLDHKNGKKPRTDRVMEWKTAHEHDTVPQALMEWVTADVETNALFFSRKKQVKLYSLDAMSELFYGCSWFRRLRQEYWGPGKDKEEDTAPRKQQRLEEEKDEAAVAANITDPRAKSSLLWQRTARLGVAGQCSEINVATQEFFEQLLERQTRYLEASFQQHLTDLQPVILKIVDDAIREQVRKISTVLSNIQ